MFSQGFSNSLLEEIRSAESLTSFVSSLKTDFYGRVFLCLVEFQFKNTLFNIGGVVEQKQKVARNGKTQLKYPRIFFLTILSDGLFQKWKL